MVRYYYTYPTVPESESKMLDDVEAALKAHNIQGLTKHRLMQAVSEAFTNAMIHGNRLDPTKTVTFCLCINETGLIADIYDEGRGALARIDKRTAPDESSENGRGVDLIGHYADRVDFAETPTGGLHVSMHFVREQSQSMAEHIVLEDTMDLTVRENGAVTIITLKGRLDLASGTQLKEQVKRLLGKNTTAIHLNLTEVEFINSSGLGALVSIMKEVRLFKGRLTLSNLASYVQEIFEITQLSHIFEIYSTEAEAMTSYSSMVASS